MNTLKTFSPSTVPGYVNILGTATNTATVSLWSKDSTALYTSTTRKADCFRREMPFNNATGALWLTITNVAALSNSTGADIVTNTVGRLFLARTPEAFTHDADGNLTNDGRWLYTWDGENRLVKQESLSGSPTASKYKLEFAYDSKGRRIQKLVSTNNGSGYVAQYTNRFVYDGWNLVAILNPQSSILQSFTWGLDLSGSEQGAGGVGGMLFCRDTGSSTTNFVAYDGNGNVMALVNVANGAVTAQYEYDPFLRIIRATGPLAYLMPFLGSTKYYDWETGWYYYGYRYLRDGWWLSRDPIGERGGKNVYQFAANNPVGRTDKLGHFSWEDHTDLATLGFADAMYILDNPVAPPCWERMRRTLVRADVWQDVWGFFDMRRHYNRDVSDEQESQKWNADRNYQMYLLQEEITFRTALSSSPAGIGCWRSLRALGRMMHSWQDFYAHAIRRDGQGGVEPGSPSSAEGWLAWTQGVTGAPDSRSNFWPSSYSLFGGGEHPPTTEPIVYGGAEYMARYNAAQDYTMRQLVAHLPFWLERCRCFCP